MKKALLVISFGTSYKETREKTIETCEKTLHEHFNDYDFYRAYTSRMIIKKIARVENLHIDTPVEALEKLKEQGYEEVLVQSLHIICGEEYNKLKEEVESFKPYFKKISLGMPLLTTIEDYKETLESLKAQLPEMKEDEVTAFMGHGTSHEAFTAYCGLDYMLQQEEISAYIGTVEGYPTLDEVVKLIQKKQVRKVHLMPLMLVAGDHATNDMAGDEDSWKTEFEKMGYEVEIHLQGMGENDKIRQQFVAHAQAAL